MRKKRRYLLSNVSPNHQNPNLVLFQMFVHRRIENGEKDLVYMVASFFSLPNLDPLIPPQAILRHDRRTDICPSTTSGPPAISRISALLAKRCGTSVAVVTAGSPRAGHERRAFAGVSGFARIEHAAGSLVNRPSLLVSSRHEEHGRTINSRHSDHANADTH